jgi:hypothetical protein
MSDFVAPGPSRDSKEVLDAVDAARLLAICERTLRRYAKSGLIPSFRIGWRLLFVRSTLLNWAAEQSKGGRS